MHSIRTILSSLLDLLYPPVCVACGRALTGTERHVCDTCWSGVVRACDHPRLADEAAAKLGPEVAAVGAAFVFQKTGPLQALVHALKYGHADDVGVWLGRRAADDLRVAVGPVDVIVPVPLHRAKERERGYNQAERIAQGLAACWGSEVEAGMLRRVRHTPTQTKLSVEQRRVNVDAAFQVDDRRRARLVGRSVLVVDDVITTGATIVACARELRRAGAGRVVAGSVAFADHDA